MKYKSKLAFLLIVILISSTIPVTAYPNTEAEFIQYLLDNRIDTENKENKPVNFNTFKRYNLIVYGEPWGEARISSNGLTEYRYLGYTVNDTPYTNSLFPNDATGTGDPTTWNYISVDGTDSWRIATNLEQGQYMMAAPLSYNGIEYPSLTVNSLTQDKAKLLNPATILNGFSVYTRHKNKNGSMWYATLLGKPMGGNTHVKCDTRTTDGKDTYYIKSGQEYVDVPITVTANAVLDGQYVKPVHIRTLIAEFQGSSKSAGGTTQVTHNSTVRIYRSLYSSPGTYKREYTGYARMKSIFDSDSFPVATDNVQFNVVIEPMAEKAVLQLEVNAKIYDVDTNSWRQSVKYDNKDIEVSLDVTATLSQYTNLSNIKGWAIYAKLDDDTNNATLQRYLSNEGTYFGKAATTAGHTFKFTIPAGKLTQKLSSAASFNQAFKVTAYAYFEKNVYLQDNMYHSHLGQTGYSSVNITKNTPNGNITYNFYKDSKSSNNLLGTKTEQIKYSFHTVSIPASYKKDNIEYKELVSSSYSGTAVNSTGACVNGTKLTLTNVKGDLIIDSVYKSPTILPTPEPSPSPIPTPTPSSPPELTPTPEPLPENIPPVAVIDAPLYVMAGTDIFVSGARSYDVDGKIVSYNWLTPGANGTITGMGGTIWYADEGTYIIYLDVIDDKGAAGNIYQSIIVLPPVPTAVIRYRGSFKENRKVTIDASNSHSPNRYPIQWESLDWNMESSDIRYIGKLGGSITKDIIAKKAGDYKVKLKVYNGRHYNETETILKIEPDKPPVADFTVVNTVIRDKEDGKYATITITDKSYSEDGDYIKDLIYTIYYDTDNNGSFDDCFIINTADYQNAETKLKFTSWGDIVPITVKKINGEPIIAQIKVHSVGRYKIEQEVKESFGQDTIPELITNSDYKKDNTFLDKPDSEKVIEVINIAPSAGFSLQEKRKVDVNVSIGNSKYTKEQIQTQINNILIPKLAAENIDVSFNVFNSAKKNGSINSLYMMNNSVTKLMSYDVASNTYSVDNLSGSAAYSSDMYVNEYGCLYWYANNKLYMADTINNTVKILHDFKNEYFHRLFKPQGDGNIYYAVKYSEFSPLTDIYKIDFKTGAAIKINKSTRIYQPVDMIKGDDDSYYFICNQDKIYINNYQASTDSIKSVKMINISYSSTRIAKGSDSNIYFVEDTGIYTYLYRYNPISNITENIFETKDKFSHYLYATDKGELIIKYRGRDYADEKIYIHNTNTNTGYWVRSGHNGTQENYIDIIGVLPNGYILINDIRDGLTIGPYYKAYLYNIQSKATTGLFQWYNSIPAQNNVNIMCPYYANKSLNNFYIDAVSWRDDSEKYYISLSDEKLTLNNNDRNNPVYTLLSDSINLIGMGSSINKAGFEALISRNDGNGMYIDSTNIDTAVTKLADYIANRITVDININVRETAYSVDTIRSKINSILIPKLSQQNISAAINIIEDKVPLQSLNSNSMAAGATHAAVKLGNGKVMTWGTNSYGQLGNGSIGGSGYTPAEINITDVNKVYAGYERTFTVKNDGTVWAWGRNEYAQLGDGTVLNRTSPTKLTGINSPVMIASGNNHNLALSSSGEVYGWGCYKIPYNYFGELADLWTTNYQPAKISGLSNISYIAASEHTSFAVNSSGELYGWGAGGDGQLMQTYRNLSAPTKMDITNVSKVAIGTTYATALKKDGTVWAWGRNDFGQLGDGSTSLKFSAVQTKNISNVIDIAAAAGMTAALKNDGSVWAWGYVFNKSITAPEQILGLSDIVQIACGYGYILAVKNDGTVWTLGNNTYGQLGNGTTNSSYTPSKVGSLNLAKFKYNELQTVIPKMLWRPEADRFMVSIHDRAYTELNNDETVKAIANNFTADEVKFIGLGRDANKAQIENLIMQNNNSGIYQDNTSLDAAVEHLADYIISNAIRKTPDIKKYVVLGEELSYKTIYSDYEDDERYAERWKYSHDEWFYENSLGKYEKDGTYLSDPILSFNKVGKYEVVYGARDNPKDDDKFDSYRLWSDEGQSRATIYVHRRPEAVYTANVKYNSAADKYYTEILESPFDMDHISFPDKGIVKKEWKWKCTDESDWKAGQPEELLKDKIYMLQLRVLDYENEWSKPNIQQLTVPDILIEAEPSNRDWHNTDVKVQVKVTVNNGSFKNLNYKWTQDTNKPTTGWQSSNSSQIDLTQSSNGQYYLHLEAYNFAGASAYVCKGFYRIDKIPPTITADKEHAEASSSVSVKVNVTDTGGSGLKTTRYCWTQSTSKPASGWINSSSSFSTIKDQDGIWYLHVEASDNATNTSYKCYGQYKIESLKITGVTIEGYWNHWRGQRDMFGKIMTVEPHRFLSWECVKINVYTTGYADKVVIRFSPELESMKFTDKFGNVYDHKEKFGYYIDFPEDSTAILNDKIKDNHVFWEYVLPLAPSTKSADDKRLKPPYKMIVTAWKGNSSVTYEIDDIDITGNIYDHIYIQPVD